MADLVQVISQPGPLTVSAKAMIESDGPAIVTLAGSVWAITPNNLIGISLAIDGAQAATAQIFANPASTHLAVVPVSFSYTFTIGEHSFELNALTGETTSDFNDFYVVTVQY
jgi:hypothetical protein